MGRKVQLSRARLQQHIVELAAAFEVKLVQDVRVTVNEACNVSGRVGMVREINAILVPFATDELTYACCLHELGHAVHVCGQLRAGINGYTASDQLSLKLDEEHYAWEWAKHYAPVWTKGMQAAMDFAYGTHDHSVRMERAAALRAGTPQQSVSDFVRDILRGK